MRQGRAVAIAAVALVGLSGCADRANDLDTYYDDPTSASTPGKATVSASASAGQTVKPSPVAAPDHTVTAAALNPQDLAAEGVQPAKQPVRLTGCLAVMPPAESPADARIAGWQYPSGSALNHQVIRYGDRLAADVLRTLRCGGRPLVVQVPPGADTARGWCEGATCTVLVARGNLLSGVQVAASTEAKATDAVKRLAPIAAQKLRQP